jgi:hypothetical protein
MYDLVFELIKVEGENIPEFRFDRIHENYPMAVTHLIFIGMKKCFYQIYREK